MTTRAGVEEIEITGLIKKRKMFFLFIFNTFLMTGVQCQVTEVFAETGSQAVLPCNHTPLSPISPSITWNKFNKGTVWRKQKSGMQFLGASWQQRGVQRIRCPHTHFERGDYSLEIFNVREEDGGQYSCSLEHRGHVIEKVVMLRIITVSITPRVLMAGWDVSLTCNVSPGPSGGSVTWMLNNSPFSPARQTVSPGKTLEIRVKEKASARLTGNWSCVVGYRGAEGRGSAALSVKGIIHPSSDGAKVYAAVGSAATLPCVFSSSLDPSFSVWEKLQPQTLAATRLLPSSSSSSSLSSQPGWDKSITLEEVEFKDAGSYRCSGSVQGQKLRRNMQLVVAKIDSSAPTKKQASATLTCQLSDTSEDTEYEWVHVTSDPNGTQSVGSVHKGKTLSLERLQPEETWGTWMCRFKGEGGILGNITYNGQVMSGLSAEKPSGFSSHSATVVGLSLFLLLLLLVLVQMYKNHQRRKRSFQYPALETIVHTISTQREERERNREKI